MKKIKISKEQIDQMVLLSQQGNRPAKIAKLMNLPLQNIYPCLRRRGVKICDTVNIEKKPIGKRISGWRIKKYIRELYDPNSIITKEVLGETYTYD